MDAHQVGISQLCPALKPYGTQCNCPYSAHLSAPPQQLPGNLVYCSLDIAIYAIRYYAGSHIFHIKILFAFGEFLLMRLFYLFYLFNLVEIIYLNICLFMFFYLLNVTDDDDNIYTK